MNQVNMDKQRAVKRPGHAAWRYHLMPLLTGNKSVAPRCTSIHRLMSFCVALLPSDTVCAHQCLVVRLYGITCTDQTASRFDRAETSLLTRPQQRQKTPATPPPTLSRAAAPPLKLPMVMTAIKTWPQMLLIAMIALMRTLPGRLFA